MRIRTGTAFTIAVLIHAAVIVALVINVSLDRPEKPDTGSGDIMHATFVPPAKGNPNGGRAESAPQPEAKPEPVPERDQAEEQKAQELKEQVAKQQEAEQRRVEQIRARQEAEQQQALALRKAELEKKQLEDQKKKLEAQKQAAELKKQAEEEARAKAQAEADKKKAETEARKKAAEEAKKKAEEEAKKKAEAEAKKKAEAEAKAKAKAEADANAQAEADAKTAVQAQANANALEDDILGTADGDPVNGKGLGQGGGDGGYGVKVRTLIEQNWRVDPSMNGKTVKVSIQVANDGTISNESCSGDKAVCKTALDTLNAIGMLPRPPAGCKECSSIVISMTPKI